MSMTVPVEVHLSRILAGQAIEELGIEASDELIDQVEGQAENLLWQARVVLAASIAQSIAPARKKPGRPRKVKTNGQTTAAAPADGTAPRRRGRPRKNPLPTPEATAPVAVAPQDTPQGVEVVG